MTLRVQTGETKEERKRRHKTEDMLHASIKMKAAVVNAEKADLVAKAGEHWSEKELEEMTCVALPATRANHGALFVRAPAVQRAA